jgi:hypothetical protein
MINCSEVERKDVINLGEEGFAVPSSLFHSGLYSGLGFLSQGCASLGHFNALPANLEDQAQIPGLPDVRDWADAPSKILLKSAKESLEQEKAAHHGRLEPVVYGLALSGGGGDRAFGAGLLCGWTEAGTRPTFKLVTGISTGSLISPFAFLGPAYIPRDFPVKAKSEFDKAYMNQLFDYAYNLAKSGYP